MRCDTLRSRGSRNNGTKSEVATSPLPSWGPKEGYKCYITSMFSAVPKQGGQDQNWLPHPYLLGGPKEGGSAL